MITKSTQSISDLFFGAAWLFGLNAFVGGLAWYMRHTIEDAKGALHKLSRLKL